MPSPSILVLSPLSANWANQAGSASSNGSSLGGFLSFFFLGASASDSAGVEVEASTGAREARAALDLGLLEVASERKWGRRGRRRRASAAARDLEGEPDREEDAPLLLDDEATAFFCLGCSTTTSESDEWSLSLERTIASVFFLSLVALAAGLVEVLDDDEALAALTFDFLAGGGDESSSEEGSARVVRFFEAGLALTVDAALLLGACVQHASQFEVHRAVWEVWLTGS